MNYIDLVFKEDRLCGEKDKLWNEWNKLNKEAREAWLNKKYAKSQRDQAKRELHELHREKEKFLKDKSEFYDLTELNSRIKVAHQIWEETKEHYDEAEAEFLRLDDERAKKRAVFNQKHNDWKEAKAQMDNYSP